MQTLTTKLTQHQKGENETKFDITPKSRKRNMLTKLQLVNQTFMNTLTNGMFSLTESRKNMILVLCKA